MTVLPLYLFYVLKSFTPFGPFIVPFLIDVKKFKNKEVYNTFNVYFFTASLIVSLFVFMIAKAFGNKFSLFLDTLLEILACLLLYTMEERSFILAKCVSIFHGSSTAMNSVLKSIVISNVGTDRNEKKLLMNNVTIIKCLASVCSAWIGQDIFIKTRQYNINQIISGITLVASACLTFFIEQNETDETKVSVLSDIKSCLNIFLDFNLMKYCLLSITANILVIGLSFFSASVFIERRRCERNKFVKYIFYIMAPFRTLSFCIVSLYYLLGGKNKDIDEESNKKELVIHGYIDGISKICAAIFCFFIGKIRINEDYRYLLSQLVVFCTLMSLFFLYKVDSLSMSYLFFTITFSLSTSLKLLLYSGYNSHPQKNFIFSFIMFFSSVIHIALSYVSIWRKSDIQRKFRYYLYVSILLSSGSLVLNLA